MELDTKKIDEAVLALLYLGLHNGGRAWKGFDWEAMNCLHEQGYISDPRGKAKSVVFTEEELERAERLLGNLFGKQAEPNAARAKLNLEQNALAKWLLDELCSEAKWKRAFAESEDVLEKLASEELEEKRKGKTTRLDATCSCARDRAEAPAGPGKKETGRGRFGTGRR